MHLLVLQHVDTEHPGVFRRFLAETVPNWTGIPEYATELGATSVLLDTLPTRPRPGPQLGVGVLLFFLSPWPYSYAPAMIRGPNGED